ncbi:hypothetical protein CVT26_002858 [Gymnopilus dilepis]|uniref:AB hydrolase-1 domain-containing protein n=1 Tax=Gymnopilus dilepis TaxID=231916 RepID=A0A409VT74_9AGAR|nr:hypothetical protein CVT26_002858 [Gymnopilus dilepis]
MATATDTNLTSSTGLPPEASSAEESYLDLPDGRRLAYASSGDPTSSCLVIFFHGVFGVGVAEPISPSSVLAKGVHCINPTLQGWGTSSPAPKGVPYHVTLAKDTTALINHLHPDDSNLRIFVAGGSFGTVPAQMLYGAPFDLFPHGRNIVGCLLLAPFSPFKYHKDYTKTMAMANYIAIGPPSQWIPFNLFQRLAAHYLKGKLRSKATAEAFVREEIFDKMKDEEKAAFKKWREERGKKEGEVEARFASNMFRSVEHTWDGYMAMADICHSDWGFRPDTLDEEHNRRPILIVGSEGDTMTPDAMAKWLAANYKNSRYRSLSGGHLAALFHIEDIWRELFELAT